MSDKDQGVFNTTVPVPMTFPNLFEAKAFGAKGHESGTPKFSANFLFDADSDDLKAMKAIALKVANARWPGRDRKANPLAFPFTSGDKLADKAKLKGKDQEFSRGKIIVAGRSKFQPRLAAILNGKVVDLEGDMIVANKSKFYGGVLVLAQFNFSAYDGVGANPDGVTAYLNLVLTTGKGEKIGGGGPQASEVFKGYVGSSTTEDPTGGAETTEDGIDF